jgi:uncharacterized delta-60 repeat protein
VERFVQKLVAALALLGPFVVLSIASVGCDGDDSDDQATAALTVTSKALPLSAAGADGFYAVTFDDAGALYATGFVSDTPDAAADRSMVVAKLNTAGELDTNFGVNGTAVKNVAVGGNGEIARAIVVQSTGKIVIAGPVEHDVAATGVFARDRDVALVRFNADGGVDDTFGDHGVVILDLNAGIEGTDAENKPTLVGADAPWALLVTSDDKLIVHASQRAEGLKPDNTPRTDSDFVLMRLTADGQPDDTFGTQGEFTLDWDSAPANARGAVLLGDGSIVAAGYANTPAVGSTQPVLYKVSPAGQLDTSFGVDGIFHEVVLPAVTEAYAVAIQGTKLVTAGYGRSAMSDPTDWVSLRVTGEGALDASYGTNGYTKIDVASQGDNGRNLVVLPDNRVVIVGGGRPTENNIDAMVTVLGADGQPDTGFAATGYQLFDLGGSADMLWGVATSPDGKHVVAAGMKAVTAGTGTDQNNDDAALLLVKVGR